MKVSDFNYELPDELIARYPSAQRRNSRLLMLDGDGGLVQHRVFTDLLDNLMEGDLLVLNDTRVLPARMFGRKESGGRLEVLVERVLSTTEVLAHVRASKSPKTGHRIVISDQYYFIVLGRQGELFHLQVEGELPVLEVMERVGHMPLPPYIDRPDEGVDRERYQTVYSKNLGAVAAPTAGLHFDESLLDAIKKKGVSCEFVTLHVGAGTFQPVRVENIEDHAMHAETINVSAELCAKINATKAAGGRIIAVGTTSVRCLESAALNSAPDSLIAPFQGDTDIFIYPGFQFKVVDAMVTNFHLPQSTLIMLISAFAGKENVMNAYQEAIEQRYRFFSYGDAMFVSRRHS